MKALAAFCAALLLAGCGTTNATVKDAEGRDLMLLGHDPVAYFTVGRPQRGDPAIAATHEGKTYYFASEANRRAFAAAPAKFEPQYGGFCANGAAYGIKLGSDPTEWEIVDGRLFIFGDVLGHEYWRLDWRFNVQKGDEMWPEAKDAPWVAQTIKRANERVAWYKTGRELGEEWQRRNPGKKLDYDPGGSLYNYFFKYPGWRAREGHMQPALGIPGVDPCPPACPGELTRGFTRP